MPFKIWHSTYQRWLKIQSFSFPKLSISSQSCRIFARKKRGPFTHSHFPWAELQWLHFTSTVNQGKWHRHCRPEGRVPTCGQWQQVFLSSNNSQGLERALMLCKHENLSSNPQNPSKKLGVTPPVYSLSFVGQRQADSVSSLISICHLNSKLLFQW